MENKNKKSSLKEDTYRMKYDDYNKVEWINYFNDYLIVESINNRINNTKNENKIISNNINFNIRNINIIKKNNISNSNKKKNTNYKESITNSKLYEDKNIFFLLIKELYGPKKLFSFDYEERITINDILDKFNSFKDKNEKSNNGKVNPLNLENINDDENLKSNKFNNIIMKENEQNKKIFNNKVKLRGNKKKNKSADSKDNNKDKNNKNNIKYRNNNSKNENTNNNLNSNYNIDHRRYDPLLSYALRHKLEKKYKLNGHFHPNEEKPTMIDKNILLGRTMPEMIVLNNYGLVNDDDYELYQNIVNYNKLNNKRNKRYGLKDYYINGNYNNNIINNNNTLKSKINSNINQKNGSEIKIEDENAKTSNN